jgi:hypothetical protein
MPTVNLRVRAANQTNQTQPTGRLEVIIAEAVRIWEKAGVTLVPEATLRDVNLSRESHPSHPAHPCCPASAREPRRWTIGVIRATSRVHRRGQARGYHCGGGWKRGGRYLPRR